MTLQKTPKTCVESSFQPVILHNAGASQGYFHLLKSKETTELFCLKIS